MNVVDFPIERCSIIGGPANDNPEPTALVCALCKCNVFRAWLREGAFVIECAYCHVAVTEGILTYAFGQQDFSA